MKHPLSFSKLVMAAAVALPTMALATITPEAPTLDNTDNCYMIGSAAELYGFAEMMNDGSGFNGCGKLTANIVVNKNVLGTDNANVNADGEYVGADSASFDKWAPINGFAGKFHGQGHTISGLYFNDPKKEKVGLFGNAGDVEIDGLGLVDSYFGGSSNVGGFVGYAGGTVYIRNSYNSSVVRGHSGDWWCGVGGFVGAADVNELEIENSYNLGFVTGGPAVGGLVGIIMVEGYFSVSNSYNAGDVKGTAEVVGGLVGYLNSGDVGAGIVGSYNTGSVVCGGEEGVGGLVGYLDEGLEILRIVNSYNTGTVDGNYAGGLVGGDGRGYAGYANVYNSYNAGLVNDGYGDALGFYYEVDNFYYLEGSSVGCFSYTGVTKEEFENGTVAEALHDYSGTAENGTAIDGSVWGQGLGRDALPTLTGAIGPALTLHVYDGVVIDSVYTPGTELPAPTREDYDFLGWYADADFSGSAVTEIPDGATGALEYFAKWEAQGGSGCYEIASAEDLFSFAARVNGGEGEICGKLTADITVNEGLLDYVDGGTFDLDGYKADHGNVEPKAWTPMNVWNPEMPVFLDGNGKKISGLYIDGGSSMENVGLFSFVAAKVAISNLGIVDSYIVSKQNAGAFAGYVTGSLDITNCYNASTIVVTYTAAGGLVGCSGTGTVNISQSYNAGAVINTGTATTAGEWPGYIAGGFVGSTESGTLNIVNSYNLGSVTASQRNVGGFVGYAGDGLSLTIANSYNMGILKNSESNTTNIVGYFATTSTMFAANNFFVGSGVNDENSGVGKSAEEFANGSVAKALHDWCEKETGSDKCKEGGLDGSVWGQDLSKENSLPEFIERLDYKLGSVTFFEKAGKIDSAYVDATSDLAVDFPNDVVVSGPIKFKRTFAGSGYSTIVLPFTPKFETDADTIAGVNFYEFSYYDNATNSVHTKPVSQKSLTSKMPYLVQSAGVNELVFKKGGTFNTMGGAYSVRLTGTGAGWTIYGTYAYKTWKEGDAGLGSTYGFAGVAGNKEEDVGQFKKIGVGAYIYPMRAYLEYVAPAPAGRPAANGAVCAFAANTVASLPDEIDVVIVEKGETGTEIAGSDDASGEQTTRVIGTINTRTGEFKFANDRWFDLNGRYLGDKKPTQKGAYYNNGKKVIVK